MGDEVVYVFRVGSPAEKRGMPLKRKVGVADSAGVYAYCFKVCSSVRLDQILKPNSKRAGGVNDCHQGRISYVAAEQKGGSTRTVGRQDVGGWIERNKGQLLRGGCGALWRLCGASRGVAARWRSGEPPERSERKAGWDIFS